MDEPSVYNRALTASEIQAIYLADSAGKCLNVPPAVTGQPQDVNVFQSDSATFTAAVSGSPPLSYQWYFNSGIIAGATNSALVLTNVQASQTGAYSLSISNAWGTTNSASANLTVTPVVTNLFDRFDLAIDGAQWSNFTTTVLATNYGGYTSAANSLWFGGAGSRSAITRTVYTLNGGLVRFNLRLANGVSSTWDSPELPSEGVVLEYTINGGASWVEMGRYDTSAFQTWTNITVLIPVAARTAQTQFRWRQLSNSGNSSDHWALDDVTVLTPPVPPGIVTNPASQIAIAGQNPAFTVVASGTLPLSYQWFYNTNTVISGATNRTLTLSNVLVSQAGTYSVLITNSAGATNSAYAALTVSPPPALVNVVGATGTAGSTVVVPVTLVANGNENTVNFSLNFDTNRVTYNDITLGSGAGGAGLFLSAGQISSGRLGVSLSLSPQSATFAAGTQELVQVTFNVVVSTSNTTTVVSFGDVPTPRAVLGTALQSLTSTFVSNNVSIVAGDYEGDATTRPVGDHNITAADWFQLGRFVAGVDAITNSGEFQRADCAPRNIGGDGVIKVTDWVQAGRYANGLDGWLLASGPTSTNANTSNPTTNGREVRCDNTNVVQGLNRTFSVRLLTIGDENAVAFSLNYNPASMTYVSAVLGANASSATYNANTNQTGTGKVGFDLSLPTGLNFSAGVKEILKLTFKAANTVTGNVAVTFGDAPVPRSLSNPQADEIGATFVNGTFTVNPRPTIACAQAAVSNLTLAWPSWAGDFTLQSANTVTGVWNTATATLTTNAGNVTTTVSASNTAACFRLYHP